MRRVRAERNARGRCFAVVAAEFNRPLADRLVEHAVACLLEHGCASADVDVYRVPGSFELPQLVSRLQRGAGYDAFIALGVLIRGETPHFDYICRAVSTELERISTAHGVPVAFGVVTADTVEQAVSRAGGENGQGGKGWEAALAAIEMADLFAALPNED